MASNTVKATAAHIIKKYTFRLATGETGRLVLEDMKDQLAPNLGHLALCFELRDATTEDINHQQGPQ